MSNDPKRAALAGPWRKCRVSVASFGDGVHLLWQEAIGTIRGRYFILTRQELDAQTAKEWGAVNEIVPANNAFNCFSRQTPFRIRR